MNVRRWLRLVITPIAQIISHTVPEMNVFISFLFCFVFVLAAPQSSTWILARLWPVLHTNVIIDHYCNTKLILM